MSASGSGFTRFINIRHNNYLVSAINFCFFSLLINSVMALKELFDSSKVSWRAFFGATTPLVVIVSVNSSSVFS